LYLYDKQVIKTIKMENENENRKIIKGAKSFINQIPRISFGSGAIGFCDIEGYGSGQIAYDALKRDFDTLTLLEVNETDKLLKKIKHEKKELKILEKQLYSLSILIGEEDAVEQASTFFNMVTHLKTELDKLIEKSELLQASSVEKDHEFKEKIDLFAGMLKYMKRSLELN
jgi:hypothetical protein